MECSSATYDFPADVARAAGADAWGVARADVVDEADARIYDRWIERGAHAAMKYMEENADVRRDPRLLLEGARSVIVMAFSYYHTTQQPASAPKIAMYAHGGDYHNVIHRRLRKAVSELKTRFSGAWRICIDSVPLRERYWAVKSGVGFLGRNGQVIVPGVGSYCFIATLISTVEFNVTEPLHRVCDGCNRCVAACPGQALRGDGSVDARRCVSYLTVEAGRTVANRGEDFRWPEGVERGDRLVGCDTCQAVCRHNVGIKSTSIEQFAMRRTVADLTADDIITMTEEEYAAKFAGSAVRRAPLAHLKHLLSK